MKAQICLEYNGHVYVTCEGKNEKDIINKANKFVKEFTLKELSFEDNIMIGYDRDSLKYNGEIEYKD